MWRAATTTPQAKKRLLRSLLEEVQLRPDEKRHLVRIVWKGGAVPEREVVRRKAGDHAATSEEIIELTRRLALEIDGAAEVRAVAFSAMLKASISAT